MKALKAAGQVGEQLGSKIGQKGRPPKNVHAGQAMQEKNVGVNRGRWAVQG